MSAVRGKKGSHPAVADLVAGVSVALILIPQSLAYAELAGMPPVRGLYAAALPPLVAAAFASSPWLQTGPVALTALLTYGALASRATPGSDEYIALAAALALIVGAGRLAIGVLRAGAITYLMSHAVLRGFTLGAAILIGSSQIPAILGVAPQLGGIFERAVEALFAPSLWDWESIGFGAMTIAFIGGGRLIHPIFPGLLLAVIAAVGISLVVGYEGTRVGPIPAGLPEIPWELPWAKVPELILPGAVIALVGFAEAASISQTFAEREQRAWDPNQEFVSQGAANVAAAVSGGFPVGGSFSRSAVNHLAGAKTRRSGGITGLAVFAVLPFAFLLAPLPKAVLGMAILSAIRSLFNPAPLIELWRFSRLQAAIAAVTLGMTLFFAPRVEIAVVVGIAVAVAVHLWREGGQQIQADFADGTLTLRPMGVMWFASAPAFRRNLNRHLLNRAGLRHLVIDLSGLGRLDLSGAFILKTSLDSARERGVLVALASIPPQLERIIARVCPEFPVVSASAGAPSSRPTTPPPEDEMPTTAEQLIKEAKSQIRTCDAEQAAKQIRERANLLLIDVREPNEHNLGVIEGAELVPRGILESKIAGICSSPEQDILIYCAGGNRAALATKTLQDMGYPNATCIDAAFMELVAAVDAGK